MSRGLHKQRRVVNKQSCLAAGRDLPGYTASRGRSGTERQTSACSTSSTSSTGRSSSSSSTTTFVNISVVSG